MPKPGAPKKPLGGMLGGIPDDVLEKLKDQASDIGQGFQDVVTGGDDQGGGEDSGSDSAAELQNLASDPAKLTKQAQQQGLTPQQLLERAREREKERQEHLAALRKGIQRIGDEQQAVRQRSQQEATAKQKEEQEEEQHKIDQLEEKRKEEEKTAVLQAKPKQKAGMIGMPQSVKATMPELRTGAD